MTRVSSFRALSGLVLSAALAVSGCSKNPEEAKKQAFEAGNAAAAQGKYTDAIVNFRKAVQADPKFGEARAALAAAYAKTGDLGNAYREYLRAADLRPDDVETQINAASFLLANEQFEDAKDRIQKAIFRDPKNPKAQIILGNAMAGLKDFESALAEMEKAVRTDPSMASGYTSIAKVKIQQGDPAQAEAAFRRAIESDPKSVLARLSLANFLWSEQRLKEAEVAFRDTVAAAPGDAVANRATATFLIGSNRPREAEPFLKVAAQNDDTPGKTQTFDLVDYYITFDNRGRALEVLGPLEANKSTSVRARTRRAYLLFTGGQKTEGYALIDAVLKDDPRSVEALVIKARLLASERKWPAALDSAKSATDIDAQYAPAWFVRGSVYADSGDGPNAVSAFNEVLKLAPRSSSVKTRLAKLNMAKGDVNTALSLAEEAASLAPADPEARLTLAQALIRSGNLTRSEQLITALLKSNSENAAVHSSAGVIAALRQQWAVSEREYRRALELDPNDFDAFSGLVGVHLKTGKTAELKALLDQRVARTPNDAAVLVVAAKGYVQMRDLERGQALLEKAIAVEPNNLDAYATIGRLLVAEGKLDDARAHLVRLTQQNPKSAWARTVLGVVLEIQNKRDEARQQYEEALGLDPNAGVAANNLASIYADTNEKLDMALQLAQTAVRQMPEVASASDTLGWVHFKRNTPWLAVSPLRRAAELEPKNPLFLYHLGLSYEKMGDKVNARASLERALSLGKFAESGDARRLLASL